MYDVTRSFLASHSPVTKPPIYRDTTRNKTTETTQSEEWKYQPGTNERTVSDFKKNVGAIE